MNYNSLFPANYLIHKNIHIIFWYIFCLYPLSTSEGYSINYIFVAPFILNVILLGAKLYLPPQSVLIFIFISFFSFSLSSIASYNLYDFYDRRVYSFILSLFALIYTFIKIKPSDIISFEIALVSISIILSLGPFLGFAIQEVDAGTAKDEFGSQRIGYILLFAIWIAIFRYVGTNKIKIKFILLIIITIILIGLVMTFSRASLISLAASLILFPFLFFTDFAKNKFLFMQMLNITTLLFIIFFVFGWLIFSTLGDFIVDRIYDPFINGVLLDNINIGGTSEGDRVAMWMNILNFVQSNPLTGSGFLGPWIVQTDAAASAHSQYFDVLFRVGILAFIVYIYIIYRILLILKNISWGLFMGFISTLIYGLTHETFRDSQGVFIFAFLLGIYATAYRSKRALLINNSAVKIK
jgi:hypothetical protein